MEWDAVADRGEPTTLAAIHSARSTLDENLTATDGVDPADLSAPPEPLPTRVVADADVLAADLLVGGDARRALEAIWQHPWMTLLASDPLLTETERLIDELTTGVAADWRALAAAWREPVTQPRGDHPAVASAYRGGAMQLLSFDETLTASTTATTLSQRFPVSIREPAAFSGLFDPASLYQTVSEDSYDGAERSPRFD